MPIGVRSSFLVGPAVVIIQYLDRERREVHIQYRRDLQPVALLEYFEEALGRTSREDRSRYAPGGLSPHIFPEP